MSFFYDPFMASLEKKLIFHRKFLIDQMSGGDVLEIGAGTGVNFSIYPKNINVYALEPSQAMFKRALQKKVHFPNIKLYNVGIEEIYKQKQIPKKFDFILSTLVLCTVKNPEKVAQIYMNLLKKDGKLLVLEHIHSDGYYGKIQQIINPVWKPFADGCNLTRRQDIILKKVGFIPETEKYFHLGTNWYIAVMIKNNLK